MALLTAPLNSIRRIRSIFDNGGIEQGGVAHASQIESSLLIYAASIRFFPMKIARDGYCRAGSVEYISASELHSSDILA